MVRLACFAVLGIAFVCISALVPGEASSALGCRQGQSTIGGAKVFVFCGPATASVTFGGRTVTFKKGSCRTSRSGTFTMNTGTVTLRSARPKSSYFGVSIARARTDGAYRKAAIGFQWRGKSYSVVTNTVKLREDRSRGTFSGLLGRAGSPKVTGSFVCA